MIYTLPSTLYGWASTTFIVPAGYALRVQSSGYISTQTAERGHLILYHCFPEGTYGSTSTSPDLRPQDRKTWQDFTVQQGTWPAINTDVPLGAVLAVKASGGVTPTFNWTKALMPWLGEERDRVFSPEELRQAAGGLPGPYTVYAAFNDVDHYDAGNDISMTLTAEIDGVGGSWQGDPWIFKYAPAIDDEDRRNGGLCEQTGYWAPGSRLVTDPDGRRVIDDFADTPNVPKPIRRTY